jgi:hypothetical protein
MVIKRRQTWSLRLKDRYFEKTSVYTTSTFLRMKLGDALQARGVAAHIAWTREEAMATLAAGQETSPKV